MNIKNVKDVIFIMVVLTVVIIFSGCTVKVRDTVEVMNIIENEQLSLMNISEEKILTEEITETVTQVTRNEPESAIQSEELIEETSEMPDFSPLIIEMSAVAEPPEKPTRNPDEKLIALTFDDGPSPYTEQILDILTQYGGKSTFFVVGYKVWDYRQIIKKTIEQGSEVAGHSWHHYNFLKLAEQDIKDQITYTADAIRQVTGINPPDFYRVPYGAFDDIVKNVSRDAGTALIQWNIDPRDWSLRDADAVYENIMETAKNGGIVVCHDTYAETAEAMERVIPYLVAQGYRLVTVSELLQYTEPGRVYYSETNSRD